VNNQRRLGHLEYLNAAKAKCDCLFIIVNNDKQVKLKGSIPFMDQNHRLHFLFGLKPVDMAYLSIDIDKSVCKTIKKIHKEWKDADLYFFNSGDRKGTNLESSEMKLCKKLGIHYQIIDLPKIYSSSELIKNACAHN
jgi:glycerol-3-phosphate cytidylyltransferase-like family protein